MTSYFSSIGTSQNPGSNASSPGASSVQSPPLGSAPRATALSNKLTSVLSASYADSDIRDALETLDAREVRNTAETRRLLRLDVQKEVIDCNGEIVQDFGKVAEQLKRIGTVVSSLNKTCEEMRKHITQAKQDTGPVLEEASALLDQRKETETKQQLLYALNKHFIISEDDLLALTSSAEPVDDRFFQILSHTKQIHDNCEVLLGGENQRLGIEIMEQSSRSLNSAYQKLYKWVQKEFKSLNLEDPHMSGSIRRALRVLAERPSLFHSCLDFFAEAREYILSDSFHYALTDSVPAGDGERIAKPIEFSAHDPLRYVGDMLAWVHSATVSEREALEALFVSDGDELAKGIQAGISNEPWSRDDGEEEMAFDGQKALNDLVNRDLNGVSRSLQQRVELVINGHEDAVTVYKVINLLAFYRNTFSRLAGANSTLVETIKALEESSFRHFETLMQDHTAMLSAEPAALVAPSDLNIPQFLSEALENLTSLLKAFDSSFEHTPESDQPGANNKFSPVLRAALDPFLDLAKLSSKAISDPTAQAIFQTNTLLAVRSTISTYPFACATHLQPLSTALATLRTNLLEIQHAFLLETSGLQLLLTSLEPFSQTKTSEQSPTAETEPQPDLSSGLAGIASLPAFQPAALAASSQRLDDFLPSALVDATDHLKRVHSPSLVKSVTEEAVEVFCRDFEFVESMIVGADEARGRSDGPEGREDEDVGDGDGDDDEDVWSLRSLFPRTTGEIRVLLS